MISFLLWCILFILCWPIAIIALILYPIVWLLLLPFRLLGFAIDLSFDLIRNLFMLPFTLVGKEVDPLSFFVLESYLQGFRKSAIFIFRFSINILKTQKDSLEQLNSYFLPFFNLICTMNSTTKTALLAKAQEMLRDQIKDIQRQLTELQESSEVEEKSSAGDKFETHQEMLHQTQGYFGEKTVFIQGYVGPTECCSCQRIGKSR
jgi:hypothetical protein